MRGLIKFTRYCSCLFTSEIKKLISGLKKEINLPISVNYHDDFGLALDNSLASFEAGDEQFNVTVNDLSECEENASRDELVMILITRYEINLDIETTQLVSLSHLVAHITGIKMPPNKVIVDYNAFFRESRIYI